MRRVRTKTEALIADSRIVRVSLPGRPLLKHVMGQSVYAQPSGTIVWIDPADASELDVEAVKELYEMHGAVRVRVLPRPEQDAPLPAAAAQDSRSTTVREIAAELLAEARVEDEVREAARGIVEACLTQSES